MCTVLIEHKNNQKRCKFFCSSWEWSGALLGMPDTDALNIININIHSIGAERHRIGSKWCANIHTVQGSTQIQETQGAEKCCANKTSISKSINNSTKPMVKAEADNLTRYFIAGQNVIATKEKVLNQCNRYIRTLMMCLVA